MAETKPRLTIASAQSLVTADVRANGREVRRLMHQARQCGARLIHFPEGAMSGYVKVHIEDWGNVDWHLLQTELEQTATYAAQLGIWAVIGSNHPLTKPHRPHNSLYVISDRGTLHTRYDKRYCSHSEISDWYTPGQERCVFTIDGWRFGCALCIEIQFPELFVDYAMHHVDCVLFSAYSDSTMFGIQAQAYAAAGTFWASLSVPAQDGAALSSRIIGPDGQIVAACKQAESHLALAILDMDAPQYQVALRMARPWRDRARQGIIHHPYQVSDMRSEEKTNF